MWYLEKQVWISSAHHLEGYNGNCKNNHGHRSGKENLLSKLMDSDVREKKK